MTAPPISALAYLPRRRNRRSAGRRLPCASSALTDFRNYRQLRLDCGPEPVVLVGANGAGKTNLLEALSFLAPGRGLRRARLDEVCRRSRGDEPDAAAWAVAATRRHAGRAARHRHRPGAGQERRRPGAPGRADRRPAGAEPDRARPACRGGLADAAARPPVPRRAGRAPALPRPPGDGARIPSMPATWRAYEQRAAPARPPAGRRRRATRTGSPRSRTPWPATAWPLAAARADTVQRLDAAAPAGRRPLPAARRLPWPARSTAGSPTWPALDAEDRLRAELAASRLRDAEAGTTSCGPHRSDLAVRHLDLDLPAAEGSTGQQKAVLVSIALAHARLVALVARPAAAPAARRDRRPSRCRAPRGAVRRGGGAGRAELDDRHRCRTFRAARAAARRSCAWPTARSRRPDTLSRKHRT